MNIIRDKSGLDELHRKIQAENASLGFIPTMGALHQGHLSLIERAQKENTYTICSVYVNPTQFNDPKDFDRYPRPIENDLKILEKSGCDYAFVPTNDIMYVQKTVMKYDFGSLEHVMEGKFRPGHFNGVATIVGKLFNLVKPTRAYFGQKDLQQTVVIRTLVNDLSFDIELVICDTLREPDGLAMSSRNTLLKPEHRSKAVLLYKALSQAKELYLSGASISDIQKSATAAIVSDKDFKLEYFEIVDLQSLISLKENTGLKPVAICVASFLGEIRLIDNMVIS